MIVERMKGTYLKVVFLCFNLNIINGRFVDAKNTPYMP